MFQKSVVRAQIRTTLIELTLGDITLQDVDAIVNAANSSLLGGGGVDGAIHRAAGPQLLAETRMLGGCATGDAKISKGYRLKTRHVIHTVGPIYQRGDKNVPLLLASAHRRSLEVALANGIKSIAFPAISTGIYGYPLHEAAPLALRTVYEFLTANAQSANLELELVRFVLFSEEAFKAYAAALDALINLREEISYA